MVFVIAIIVIIVSVGSMIYQWGRYNGERDGYKRGLEDGIGLTVPALPSPRPPQPLPPTFTPRQKGVLKVIV